MDAQNIFFLTTFAKYASENKMNCPIPKLLITHPSMTRNFLTILSAMTLFSLEVDKAERVQALARSLDF